MKWIRIETTFASHRSIKRILNNPELGLAAVGALVILWTWVATFGRDPADPGRAVDSDGEPFPFEDLVVASQLSTQKFKQLIDVLVATKGVDVDAWSYRSELRFPGISSRADEYTKKRMQRDGAKAIATAGTIKNITPEPINARLVEAGKHIPDSDIDTPFDLQGSVSAPEAAPSKTIHFDAFWSLYPRRENKKKARAAWLKLKAEKDPQLCLAIMQGLESQVAAWDLGGKDPAYICHADQFIKHQRWEDEPIPPPSKPKSIVEIQSTRDRFMGRHKG
jgi:hypothetical protein|tara:strand:- start:23768 stop:24601 length:834 start_codon:yes stop_codon:yes gene_type:complete